MTNKLSSEKSPYLLQHKNNPVNWYPWGEEAFSAAKTENKPIFLSIGYSTCYWCHVMEKDSFEIQEVADVMNELFINIKVDREERPDVDAIYMDAVVALTGRGGWPMSVFLTPDLKPFYGGTFFYKDQFIQVLKSLRSAWDEQREKVTEASEQITQAIKISNSLSSTSNTLDYSTIDRLLSASKQHFDSIYGGFGPAPKFPPSAKIQALFRIYKRTKDNDALQMALHTLDNMAFGGLYDHLGGGFARYSTDNKWLVPHFEKMLYDNALLTMAYLEAYQITKKEHYCEIAKETLNYVLVEMTSDEGGFFSAQDAGEVDAEGEFYVWEDSELLALLSDDEYNKLEEVYGVSASGNFEGKYNILNLQNKMDWADKKDPLIKSAHKKLLAARNKREHPHKDDKVLTSWNGLMISAMTRGYQILEDEKYLNAAKKSALFIKETLYKDKKLQRRYRDGESNFSAVLDDYSYLIQGLLDLYESDFDYQWIQWAEELQEKQDELFWDDESLGYFFSPPDDSSLIVRQKEMHDGAIPSANGISALNLLRLYELSSKKPYSEKATNIFSAISDKINRAVTAFSSSLIALDFHLDSTKEIAVVGDLESKEAKEIKKYLYQSFIPNKVIAFGEPLATKDETGLALLRGKEILNDKTTFYICENHTCKLPTNDIEQAKALIDSRE